MREIFEFSKSKVETFLSYEMNLFEKFKTSFNYIVSKLPNQSVPEHLNNLQWNEGKSYNWAVIKDDRLTLIIRKYRRHFTIYFKNIIKISDDSEYDDIFYSKYGCFTFFTNVDKIEDYENYEDDDFFDLNSKIAEIVNCLKKGKIHFLSSEFDPKTEPQIEVKNIWNGGDNIVSIDDFIFCCEEMFSKHLELFSKNEMLEKIKTLNEGDFIDRYVITDISTEVKDNNYHGVGLMLKKDDDERFEDVFSLSRWYYDIIFK